MHSDFLKIKTHKNDSLRSRTTLDSLKRKKKNNYGTQSNIKNIKLWFWNSPADLGINCIKLPHKKGQCLKPMNNEFGIKICILSCIFLRFFFFFCVLFQRIVRHNLQFIRRTS